MPNLTFTIKKQSEHKQTMWSGGKTTEIAIFPPDSNYSDRLFLWRLSSATIEVDHSVFTPLGGFKRIIMPLKGGFTITHEGRYEKYLKPFDQDFFDGGWKTSSKGSAVDFNLIMIHDVEGKLIPLYSMQSGESHRLFNDPQSEYETVSFYSLNDDVTLNFSMGLSVVLESGDYFACTAKKPYVDYRDCNFSVSCGLTSEKPCAVMSKVSYNL